LDLFEQDFLGKGTIIIGVRSVQFLKHLISP